jgi:UDP-N-acetyl-D-glucosamine dehydrogenase
MVTTIVGQGYVGLPLAMAACNAGHKVYGLDSNSRKISDLTSGKSDIEDISDREIQSALHSGNYIPTSDYSVIGNSDVILICVPTPLSSERKPDFEILTSAISEVSINIKKGSIVIVESTIQPGTCRNLLIPLLINKSGLKIEDIDFAYSPERIDPTNQNWNVKNTPKLVAGNTSIARDRAVEFYQNFVTSVVKCSSLEVAEMAKLLENSFRLVNISFINEIADFCQKIGVNVIDVIEAASTKPYGFMPFYPGLGAGGHCIPVDPLYLLASAKENGSDIKFIEHASQVNYDRPKHFIDLAEKRIGNLNNKKILVVGVSYKPNVADVRETPVEHLLARLCEMGAIVSWHDDLVKEWKGQKSVALSGDFDLAIIATAHDYLELSALGKVPTLNTRGSN